MANACHFLVPEAMWYNSDVKLSVYSNALETKRSPHWFTGTGRLVA